MLLHRGYVGNRSNDFRPKWKSEISLEYLEFMGLSPHLEEYMGKLLWVSPERDFAEGVATSRYVVRAALNPETLVDDNVLPAVVTFEPDPEKTYCYGEGEVVLSQGRITTQMLVREIDPSTAQIQLPLLETLRGLEKAVTENCEQTGGFVGAINLVNGWDKDKLNIPVESFSGMTFLEGIKTVYDLGVEREVFTPATVEDRLAAGIFIHAKKIFEALVYESADSEEARLA